MEPKRLEVKRPRPTKRSDPHNDFTPESLEAKRRSEITRKALHTAKWARTMTKWLITHSGKGGVKWRLVEFGGKNGHESKGVVDMIAIRKDYKTIADGGHIGDLLDIVTTVRLNMARRVEDQALTRVSGRFCLVPI